MCLQAIYNLLLYLSLKHNRMCFQLCRYGFMNTKNTCTHPGTQWVRFPKIGKQQKYAIETETNQRMFGLFYGELTTMNDLK